MFKTDNVELAKEINDLLTTRSGHQHYLFDEETQPWAIHVSASREWNLNTAMDKADIELLPAEEINDHPGFVREVELDKYANKPDAAFRQLNQELAEASNIEFYRLSPSRFLIRDLQNTAYAYDIQLSYTYENDEYDPHFAANKCHIRILPSLVPSLELKA